MANNILRDTLSLNDGERLNYSFSIGSVEKEHPAPLIVCLHPGWEGQRPQLYYGEQFLSGIFMPCFAKSGAVIAAPDCPSGSWNNPTSIKAIFELIEELAKRIEIDQNQVSVVGYSAGGWGTWYMLLDHADRFASAIVFATLPVMDEANQVMDNFPKSEELVTKRLEEWASIFPRIPMYLIHSDGDELFPIHYAKLAYEALKQQERPVNFYEVGGVGHFDGGGYIDALLNTVPWLIDTWES